MTLSDPWTGPERTSRCYACCQENCGYANCSCDCHGRRDVIPAGRSTRRILPMPPTCRNCGFIGAHYCAGPRRCGFEPVSAADMKELLRAAAGSAQCPDHRRYQAKRRPRSACEACWRIWIALNPMP